MSRLIATRISDEQYSKIMGKCSGLGCSVYDYLKMLVESDIADTKQAKPANTAEKTKSLEEEEIRRLVAEIRQNLADPKTGAP